MDLDLYEANTHLFVLKVWLEQTEEEAGSAAWRGQIRHVMSGEQRSVQCLDDILGFVATYLIAMGVKLAGWPRRQRLSDGRGGRTDPERPG
jgi:hypothetical protein